MKILVIIVTLSRYFLRHEISSLNDKFLKKYQKIILNNSQFNLNDVILLSKRFVEACIGIAIRYDVPLFVGFSGGKESTTLLHLTINVTKKLLGDINLIKVLYIEIPGNTHEKNIEYVYYIIETFEIPKKNLIHLKSSMDFFEALKKWGFPSYRRRWCMNVFKRHVLLNFLKRFDIPPIVLVGDRLSDSSRRRNLLSKKGFIEFNKAWYQFTAHPLLHWKRWHVLMYILLKKIELNPLYKEIKHSGNCIYCPFITDIEYYELLREKYPAWYKKIIDAERNMKNGGGALFVSNRVFRLEDLLEKNNSALNENIKKILRYKRPCYYCMI